MARIAAVILAAGLGSRFGSNKLLAPLMGKPLLHHCLDAALASTASSVIVVTGHESSKVKDSLPQTLVEVVHNDGFSTGLSSSLRYGLNAVPADCDGAIILLGDMPFVRPAIIDGLIAMYAPEAGRAIGVPLHRGDPGNPVLWGRPFFPEILALSGDRGAKSLIAKHPEWVYSLETGDAAVHIDIDTPDDLPQP